ncbi:MAG: hypothetical protein KJ072_15115 [Verrucomicrobia bacterium]|nr:hypothetical protein [Verrucomicrobiota bacterium]
MPLAVLHASLLLRMASDLAHWPAGRTWGAAGNGVAIGLFLLTVIAGFVFPPRK